jgi:hypothetical protein
MFQGFSCPSSSVPRGFEIGAPGRTRTSTSLPTTDFESAASTNSATGAGAGTWGKREARSTGVNVRHPEERAERASKGDGSTTILRGPLRAHLRMTVRLLAKEPTRMDKAGPPG